MPTKATAAAGSVTIGGALASLVIALWWPGADATSAVALTTVANAVIAFAGAFLPKMEGS